MSYTRTRLARAAGYHYQAAHLRPGDETFAGIISHVTTDQDTGEIMTTYEDGYVSFHHPEEPITVYEAGGEYDDPSL